MQEFFIRAGRLAHWTGLAAALLCVVVGIMVNTTESAGFTFSGLLTGIGQGLAMGVVVLILGRAARYLLAGE